MLAQQKNSVQVKPILHYALGLRFGTLKHSKTREKYATDSRFYPLHSVIQNNFLAFFSRF